MRPMRAEKLHCRQLLTLRIAHHDLVRVAVPDRSRCRDVVVAPAHHAKSEGARILGVDADSQGPERPYPRHPAHDRLSPWLTAHRRS